MDIDDEEDLLVAKAYFSAKSAARFVGMSASILFRADASFEIGTGHVTRGWRCRPCTAGKWRHLPLYVPRAPWAYAGRDS